ncbi:DsrE family protein [Thermosipho atlanticus]|nr:DsrE family protein [Thermosipho atlanticus]
MEKLVIIWTTNDKQTFNEVIFPYLYHSNEQNWWSDLTLIIWGASEELVAKTPQIKEKIKILKDRGIKILACKWCADNHSITEKLSDIADVVYVGKPITDFLKGNYKVLTF